MSDPGPLVGTEAAALAGLVAGGWRDLPLAPFRDGIAICRLADGPPAVAVLVYAAGASVPRHRHAGLETVLVLDGVQSDERGDHSAGTLVLNPEGTAHSVWSDGGCAVLISWARPVEFV